MGDDGPGQKQQRQPQQQQQQQQNRQVSRTQCSNCGTTKTPLWRRAPNGDTICNACGLFLKARNAPRPVTDWSLQQHSNESNDSTLMEQEQQQQGHDDSKTGSCPGDGHCNGTGGSASCAGCPAYNQHHQDKPLQCSNCGTRTTPLWRRDLESNIICNACGLYYRLHNAHRPITMKRTMIKRRKRSGPLPNIDLSSTTSNSSLLAAAEETPTIISTVNPNSEKQQHYIAHKNGHDDLEASIAEFDVVINRLQCLRREILLQRTNKTIQLIELTDSLRDVITKAEVALFT